MSAISFAPLLGEGTENLSNFALFVSKAASGATFVLLDVQKLKEKHANIESFKLVLRGAAAAYLKLGAPGTTTGPCGGALYIAEIARNPEFPGSGFAVLKLASVGLNVGITGDRYTSNTDDARALYRKLKQNGFEETELNNFGVYGKQKQKVYLSFDAENATEATVLSGPKVENPELDCFIGNEANRELQAFKKLKVGSRVSLPSFGTPFSFKISDSSVPFSTLVSNYETARKRIAQNFRIDEQEIDDLVLLAGERLFDKAYYG